MAVDPKVETAWLSCPFCSQTDFAIGSMIRDEREWRELPLQHACAWKRICQVAWRQQIPQYEGALWSRLCSYRSEVNNQLSYQWDEPAWWSEGWCRVYRDVNTTDEVWAARAAAAEAQEPGGWRAGFRVDALQVTGLEKDTPGETAGLRVGDVVVRVCGRDVEADDDVYALQAEVERGGSLPLEVLRGSTRVDLVIYRPTCKPRRPW